MLTQQYRWFSFTCAMGCIVILMLTMALPAQASLVVTVGDLALSEKGTGNVNVSISSDTGADVLDLFGVVFVITTSGGTQLEFVHPASDLQLTNPNYIFYGDTAGALASPIGLVDSPYNTYIGGDGTLSGSGVTVPSSCNTLLVTLQVTADTVNMPVAGDTFTISLVNSDPSTFFYDTAFNDVAFSSTSGTVTIIASEAAVPEPSSLLVLIGLAASISAGQWRRRMVSVRQ